MKIRSGSTYLLAALLSGAVACSSTSNNNGTGGSGGHFTGGNGGHGAFTGGGGNGGLTGGGGNAGSGTAFDGGVTGGGGSAGSGVVTGGGGNGGNHGGGGNGGRGTATGGAGGNGGNHGGGGNGVGGNGGAVALTDPQIAGVAMTANMGEVAQGQLAGTKSTNSAVLNFATMMITDHNAAIVRLQQVLAAQNIMTADSPERQTMFNMANTTYNTLFTQTGSTFDRNYAMAQVTEHQTVLDTFDQMLVPDAQNAALKAELQMERATVATHLTMAQALVATISSDGGVTHDAGGDH